jgi:hypothetical protein
MTRGRDESKDGACLAKFRWAKGAAVLDAGLQSHMPCSAASLPYRHSLYICNTARCQRHVVFRVLQRS